MGRMPGVMALVTAAALLADATAAVPLVPGRMTTIVVSADVGKPVERAVPNRSYAAAVAADAEMRWTDAEALYREAESEWSATARIRPSRALELAIAKAERERQRSQLLSSLVRSNASRPPADDAARRGDALGEGRLLRAKLMAVRAFLARVPPAVYSRTRDRLQDALHAVAGTEGTAAGPTRATVADIHLLLCATYAAGGEPAAARLERAQVSEAERADATLDVSMAACDAALGDREGALSRLEVLALHPGPGRADRLGLRELYIANDWDRLRDDPRFERLFRR
jgi:hypothetical protein